MPFLSSQMTPPHIASRTHSQMRLCSTSLLSHRDHSSAFSAWPCHRTWQGLQKLLPSPDVSHSPHTLGAVAQTQIPRFWVVLQSWL
jgi:hypothetical protein